jgi:hypothetical protein
MTYILTEYLDQVGARFVLYCCGFGSWTTGCCCVCESGFVAKSSEEVDKELWSPRDQVCFRTMPLLSRMIFKELLVSELNSGSRLLQSIVGTALLESHSTTKLRGLLL